MTLFQVVCSFAFLCTLVAAAPSDKEKQELQARIEADALLSTPKLIRKYGYPAEVHSVTTEDGCILEMHRIPYGIKSPEAPNKPAVFLQHGLLTSSGDWVIMGVDKGFAYILADLGYDVWMGNSRGNTYSRKHTTLDPGVSNGTYWNFSWHEMGMYDLPAEIDYILQLVEQPNLFYIGHSQGTTQFYVMASERPEYNDKIRAMFSLAPIGYMSNLDNPVLQLIADNLNNTDLLEEALGIHEFLPHSNLITLLGDQFCKDGAVFQVVCENFIFLICGFDSEQLNSTMLPVIMGHAPAGASTKQLLHYAQEILSGKFGRYDYGVEGNLEEYGTETPPDYDLSKITSPVALHYSLNDLLAAVVDVNQMYEELANPIGMFLVPLPKFSHLDFIYGIDVKTLLYDTVTDMMAGFLKK